MLSEAVNIKVHTTGAESPWSNGIIERHNSVLLEMLNKVPEENHCSLDIALNWFLNAINTLQNVHGFSPFQLEISQNPSLSCTFTDKSPALSMIQLSKIISDNLNIIHKPQEAFMMNKNSEKIQRALRHNICTSNNNIFVTGDSVCYKRSSDRKRRGPAKVLGKDGQQVQVKHGGTYVRCQPCRLSLEQSNQHQQSSQAQTASSNNPDSDSDTNTLRITNPSRQKLTATNSNVTSSDIENEHKDNYETLKQKYHSKEIVSDAEDLSLSLPSQLSTPQKKASNISKEPKKDMIIHLKTDKQDSWKQVKILPRSGEFHKSKSGKYKNLWDVSDDQGYTKVILRMMLKNGKKLGQIMMTKSIDHLSRSLSDLQFSEKGCDANSTEEILVNKTHVTQVNHEILNAKERKLQSWRSEKVFDEIENNGQPTISVCWVLKQKLVDGKCSTKTRLCARGFEEVESFKTESPTCSRESVHVAITLIVSNKWNLNAINIKTAFHKERKLTGLS